MAASFACLGQVAGSCMLNLLPAASRIAFNFLGVDFERSEKETMLSAFSNSAIFLTAPSQFHLMADILLMAPAEGFIFVP